MEQNLLFSYRNKPVWCNFLHAKSHPSSHLTPTNGKQGEQMQTVAFVPYPLCLRQLRKYAEECIL